MATPQNLFALNTGKLTLKRHAIENAASGRNQLKRIKRASRQWTIKPCRLYAKGLATREIVDTFKEMYDADISPTLISRVTNAVIEQLIEQQARPLVTVYPIVDLDRLVVKIRQDKQVINKAIYLALGVNIEGHKELLGMWI